ncbi:GPN-loop GTPase 1 [Apophysomyces sp. BC1034]|nr:GPN-loop GTPase 1 [Apophysomyces sp. BC1015]KAG0178087.1 GPN-loop GTPase 1 [Apophysomyces sp. BC1021]KAG0191326.1 GPN-loop GTPase 1 [Apophysomyces sp. BC1034]
MSTQSTPQQSTGTSTSGNKQPPVILCIGMAGSGKTTFMQRINAHLHEKKTPPYVLNLDPAVGSLPFTANIDIRDTVNYKEVMKQYNLGPNGGILTALNLFTTKFDQVLNFVAKRSESVSHILVDTPGQIEIFTWSASGAIITDTLAATYPTVIAYIIDTPRTTAPATFMSNMLYACSILYKTKLPFILVFNKTDVVSHDFAVEWMTDFEKFQQALSQDTSYMSSLMNSMSLVLDEFYNHLKVVGLSAVTGAGVEDFFKAVDEAADEYEREYKPEIERLIREKMEKEEKNRQHQLNKLMNDMKVSKGTEVALDGDGGALEDEVWDEEDDEEDEHVEDSEDENPLPAASRFPPSLSQQQHDEKFKTWLTQAGKSDLQ